MGNFFALLFSGFDVDLNLSREFEEWLDRQAESPSKQEVVLSGTV